MPLTEILTIPWPQCLEVVQLDGCAHHAVDDCCPAEDSMSQLSAAARRAALQSVRSPASSHDHTSNCLSCLS